MKLVKIEDIRVDQVYSCEGIGFLVVKVVKKRKEGGDLPVYYVFDDKTLEFKYVETVLNTYYTTKLIGFLGITHKITDIDKDNMGLKMLRSKLVEIPRKEYEVDDVIDVREYETIPTSEETPAVITKNEENYFEIINVDGNTSYLYLSENAKPNKLGILGVDYEFVNNKTNNHVEF
jgi:phosphoenolpyruvate synthase/pyruvate phosphate dikinase